MQNANVDANRDEILRSKCFYTDQSICQSVPHRVYID